MRPYSGTFCCIGQGYALTVDVDGRSGPWNWSSTLNSTLGYGSQTNGLANSNWGPTVISNSGVTWYVTTGGGSDWGNTAYQVNTSPVGLPITPGDTVDIAWLDGNVCGGAGGSAWTIGANGDPNLNGLNASIWHTPDQAPGPDYTPAFYIPASQFPVTFMELIGVFADATGAIVGGPFVIGDGPVAFVIPSGASQLQLGFADGWYNDNFGTLQVNVTEPAVTGPAVAVPPYPVPPYTLDPPPGSPPPGSPAPVPPSFLLLAPGLVGLAAVRRRFKR